VHVNIKSRLIEDMKDVTTASSDKDTRHTNHKNIIVRCANINIIINRRRH